MQIASSFKLNADLIENCNNENDFNAGDVIANEADNTYKGFCSMLKSFGNLNKKQAAYVEVRQNEWKKLVEQIYNDELIRRSNIIIINDRVRYMLRNGQILNTFIADSVREIKKLAE